MYVNIISVFAFILVFSHDGRIQSGRNNDTAEEHVPVLRDTLTKTCTACSDD